MLRLDPEFTLIERGERLSGSDFKPSDNPVIDVAKSGARGVIAGLLSDHEIYLLRDPASPPDMHADSGKIWLQTSGTTGKPKWASHNLDRLMSKIATGAEKARWLLSFNPGSFAGLQVILSAMAGGHTLIAPDYGADIAEMADLSVQTDVTHISGTPTFWRAFLMALGNRNLALKSVTLGGEAADQGILDSLLCRFPAARLRHIYATTEVGTVFSVSDGLAGFPASWLGLDLKGIRLSISDHETLTVVGVDTGDVIEIIGDRALFRGRLDAMVNVGGVKVYPESVETHLLQLSCIQDVRVLSKPNPITGHILTAEIVLKPQVTESQDSLLAQIKAHLHTLPRSHRPASVRIVEALDITATGKKVRS